MRTPAFGWRDYWRMLTSGRPWLPWRYFREAHAFDLRRGTDTHVRVPKEDFGAEPAGFAEGTFYMASWTSEIDWAFRETRALLGPEFDRFAFVDVGCGKGKAVLRWTELCARAGSAQRIAGFDYHEPLVAIARRNHAKRFGAPGLITTADAERFDFAPLGGRVLCYLYNPFGPGLMRRFLERLRGLDVVLIYNNPAEDATLRAQGFVACRIKDGGCPNAHTIIYANLRRPAN
jgi:SAM-dependent methyltransferase